MDFTKEDYNTEFEATDQEFHSVAYTVAWFAGIATLGLISVCIYLIAF